MKWTSIIKARRKYPHDVKADKATQMRLDMICENINCPAHRLKRFTMGAHGDPHYSECDMCGEVKMLGDEE